MSGLPATAAHGRVQEPWLVCRSAPEAFALPFQLVVDLFEGVLVTVDFRGCFRVFDDGALVGVVDERSQLRCNLLTIVS